MMSARKRKQCTINPPTSWHSHAPGSLMLFGEHAVLHGYPAIACAIDHWLHIDWVLCDQQDGQQDDALHIYSSLAEHHTHWSVLEAHPKLHFVLAGLRWLKDHLAHFPRIKLPALSITIRSDINSTQGLGSSSAVMAALLTGFAPLLPQMMTPTETFLLGRELIRQVQGSGSGTDLAVALAGGVSQLTPKTGKIERLADSLPLVNLYVGYKTPTPEVIRQVQTDWQAYPDLLQHQLMSISQVTHLSAQAIRQQDLIRLGRLMNMAQGLMQGLGVSDANLDRLIHQLRACDGILGAKISGSGLGDCVIALGTTTQRFAEEIAVTISKQGAYLSNSPK